MISAAVGRGGETLISAQTTEAFWNAVKHVKPLSVAAASVADKRGGGGGVVLVDGEASMVCVGGGGYMV